MSADAEPPELWALNRIEDFATPYHDWRPYDVPVLAENVELCDSIDGIDIVRAGVSVGRMRGEEWIGALSAHLRTSSRDTADLLATRLSISFDRLAEALFALERLGVVRTELAERCALGVGDG